MIAMEWNAEKSKEYFECALRGSMRIRSTPSYDS
jgi:hypothetical protein